MRVKMPDQRTGQLNQIRKEGRDRAVVFLHGFVGTRDDTWDRFPGLLGTQLQGWDIFTLGYATTLLPDVVGVWSADPDLPILATMFRTELEIQPLQSYASLALIAHSMGGLVVQRTLCDNPELAQRVSHVILFGTPSGGLRKVSWIRFWKRQFRNMARDGQFIRELRSNWTTRFRNTPPFNFLVVAGASDQFVTPDSSLGPFDPKFHRIVSGNHLDIVKPQDSGAASLRVVLSALSDAHQVPPETIAPLALAAERPETDAALLVASREQAGSQLSEKEIVQSALALERAGDNSKAIQLLETHQALGTDVQGALAGRMKRLWVETEQASHAQRAFELYSHALMKALERFQEAENSLERIQAREQIYYHAINVAFLELTFHSRPDKAKEMAQLAEAHATAASDSVWSVATCAEARLYLGDKEGALELYHKLLSIGGEAWQYASAGLQASRIASTLEDRPLAERLDVLFTPGARQLNRIFVSYTHKDAIWVKRLQTMAKPYLRQAETELVLWVDRERIQPGDIWRSRIDAALKGAGVVVALVSAEFLASDFIWKYEMPEILNAASNGKLRLLWVYLSPAGWEETALKDFQAAHDTSQPLTALSQQEQDDALKRIAQELKRVALGATERFVNAATPGSV